MKEGRASQSQQAEELELTVELISTFSFKAFVVVHLPFLVPFLPQLEVEKERTYLKVRKECWPFVSVDLLLMFPLLSALLLL